MAIRSALIASIALFASASVQAQDTFVVEDIRIEGLQRVALGAALLSVPVQVGDTVDGETAAIILRSLNASNHFEDIRVFQDDTTLLIKVREKPTISNIEFSGNKDIKDEQLQESLDSSKIQVGESLERSVIADVEKGLADFYYSIGKYNAKVQAIVTPLPRNRVSVQFVFTEGEAAEIDQINIVGNTIYSDQELLETLELRDTLPWWDIMGNRRYQKQTLEGDLETLTSYYRDRGYIRFEVESTQVAMTPNKKSIYISINVKEGEPYHVKEVKLSGNLLNRKELLQALFTQREGDLYNAAEVTFSEERISKYLGRFGYAYPEVTTFPELDDENNEVTLNVNINPGKRIYVRRINFAGNTITKDEVLRREMRQLEGAWLSNSAVELSENRLNRLGYFETAESETNRLPQQDDMVDLEFTVKEQPSGSFTAGLGYGTDSGLSLQAGVQQSNFLGTGNKIGAQINTNKYNRRADFSYSDPYFTKDGVSFGGRIFYSEFDAGNANLISYDNTTYGLSTNLGFPLDEYNRINLGVGYNYNELSNLDDYDQVRQFYLIYGDESNPDGQVNFNTFDFNAGWSRVTLNRGTFPTSGSSNSANAMITTPNSDLNYFTINYNYRQYWPLDRRHDWVIATSAQLGYGNGYGSESGHDHIMPFFKNFRAGGSSSLRGFESRGVGPRGVRRIAVGSIPPSPGPGGGAVIPSPSEDDFLEVSSGSIGGNALAVASLELIVPTPFMDEAYKNSVRTSLFFDVGNLWDTEFDYDSYKDLHRDQLDKIYDYSDPTKIRASVGLTVQWLSPMGPMIFSFAKPLEDYTGDKTETFSFNVGQTF
ncbi:outer membrane protein assembly factor BamA [Neiella sp. HB171785]|uniref:Outer membrane protein assembly factor BamA n=1 Tax=Neiella litorisoli TaxID=2771431 RepID=A0A8J6QQF9_9GAMM|nr:outer membrane protein assembly factor BamA [Neiella litorisoli]MBD1389346.1 outer membrane protein assembly factor BamA [Neiella litorisoli]